MDQAWLFSSDVVTATCVEKGWIAMGQVYTEEYPVTCL